MMQSWPLKRSFEPPRYPNAWFLVSTELAAGYREAIALILRSLEHYVGLADAASPSAGAECSDAQARLHHILPATGLPDPARDHYHDLHIRYYFSHLPRQGEHRVSVQAGGRAHDCWRLAASVHFEVEAEHPDHAYIDECPICGVVAPYDLAGDRCEKCHDPLGLELLFYGTVRGQTVLRANGDPVGGLKSMAGTYGIHLCVVEPPNTDMNTLRIGTALLMPRRIGGVVPL